MRHGLKKRKLNRTSSHRQAMFRAMTCSLLEHELIKTTLPKAKALRPIAEKIITMAKNDTLHTRRMAIARLQKETVVRKLFDNIAKRFIGRPGGYVRITKAGFRYGDAAPMAIVELVERESLS
jgi:large subunit ribosomal protein L17